MQGIAGDKSSRTRCAVNTASAAFTIRNFPRNGNRTWSTRSLIVDQACPLTTVTPSAHHGDESPLRNSATVVQDRTGRAGPGATCANTTNTTSTATSTPATHRPRPSLFPRKMRSASRTGSTPRTVPPTDPGPACSYQDFTQRPDHRNAPLTQGSASGHRRGMSPFRTVGGTVAWIVSGLWQPPAMNRADLGLAPGPSQVFTEPEGPVKVFGATVSGMTERTIVLAVLGAVTAIAVLTAFIYRDELIELAEFEDEVWAPDRG